MDFFWAFQPVPARPAEPSETPLKRRLDCRLCLNNGRFPQKGKPKDWKLKKKRRAENDSRLVIGQREASGVQSGSSKGSPFPKKKTPSLTQPNPT